MKPCINCHTDLANDALFCLKCGKSQVATGEDTLLGTVVADRYLVKSRVGAGSSGTVYDARHVTLQQRMALKLLHHHLCQDPVAIERFRREATTVAHLDHPHIIGVRDFGTAQDGRLYLAMEFLEGLTLAEVLAESAPLTVARTLDIVSQVTDALTEAHEGGYVHRDLRPRNVFLTTRRGREDFVKVMDFGLAKLMLHELEPGQATVGMSFSDPTYLSPEQAGGEAADRRSDVYALGVMVYEMLAGAPPLKGNDVFATINMHLRVKPEPPSRKNRNLPFAFDAPILKALAKKPAERFETVAALRDALIRAAGSTTAPGLGTPTGSGKRRRDQTMPAIPSRIRESAEHGAVMDPNVTALGLGPAVVPPSGAAGPAAGPAPPETPSPAVTPAPSPVARPPAPDATTASPPAPDATTASPPAPDAAAAATASPLAQDAAKTGDAATASPPAPEPAPSAARTPLPERPEGSGPHAIPPPSGEAGPTPGGQGPARPGEEVPDPTMSQMWYSAGEAEAAEAMAEYEEHLREARKGRAADFTEPVIVAPGESTMLPAVRAGTRNAVLALVGVVVVVAVVVAVLISRPGRETKAPSHGRAAMGTPGAPGPDAQPDAGPRPDAASPPRDAQPVTVIDMAVQIDAPDPRGMRPGTRRPPGHHGVWPRRVRPRPDAGVPKGTEAAQAVSTGRQALARGDLTTAQVEFQRALTVRPGYAPALAGLGEVDFEKGQYGRAASRLRSAARAMPGSVKTWVLLGNAYFRSGRYAPARDAFRTALRLSPGNAEAKRNLALVEKRLGTPP